MLRKRILSLLAVLALALCQISFPAVAEEEAPREYYQPKVLVNMAIDPDIVLSNETEIGKIIEEKFNVTFEPVNVIVTKIWKDADGNELESQPGVALVTRFGNAIHISGHDPQLLEKAVQPYLQRPGIRASAGLPALEDVFIHLMRQSADNFAPASGAPHA